MTSHDTAAVAAFVHALDDLLCVPASLNDLAAAESLQSPSEFPSATASVDTQDYSEYPGNEHHKQDQDYTQDAKST